MSVVAYPLLPFDAFPVSRVPAYYPSQLVNLSLPKLSPTRILFSIFKSNLIGHSHLLPAGCTVMRRMTVCKSQFLCCPNIKLFHSETLCAHVEAEVLKSRGWSLTINACQQLRNALHEEWMLFHLTVDYVYEVLILAVRGRWYPHRKLVSHVSTCNMKQLPARSTRRWAAASRRHVEGQGRAGTTAAIPGNSRAAGPHPSWGYHRHGRCHTSVRGPSVSIIRFKGSFSHQMILVRTQV